MHNILTERAVTGVLHLVDKIPSELYSKKQHTFETATCGSEFVAARTCIEQIIDIQTTLRYLGVPIRNKSYMFVEQSGLFSKKYLDQMIGLITTIITYYSSAPKNLRLQAQFKQVGVIKPLI
jgi:hypothetical protein